MLKNFPVRFALVTVAVCTLLAACKEDKFGVTNVIPGGDFLNGTFTDTFTVATSTELEDTLQTQNLSRFVLGVTDDDIFGVTTAGIYSQLRLTSFGLNFDDGATVDSAILSLTYA